MATLSLEQQQEMRANIQRLGVINTYLDKAIKAQDQQADETKKQTKIVRQIVKEFDNSSNILDDINNALSSILDTQEMILANIKSVKPSTKSKKKPVGAVPQSKPKTDASGFDATSLLKTVLFKPFLAAAAAYLLKEFLPQDIKDNITAFVSGLTGFSVKEIYEGVDAFSNAVEAVTVALAAYYAARGLRLFGLLPRRLRPGAIAILAGAGAYLLSGSDDEELDEQAAELQRQIDGFENGGVVPEAQPDISSLEGLQGGGSLTYNNRGQGRSEDLDPRLVQILQAAAYEYGLNVSVGSGGNPMSLDEFESYPADRRTTDYTAGGTRYDYLDGELVRVGSTRHDNGGAADIALTDAESGRTLSKANAEDRERIQAFLNMARALGATGIGVGEGYMGNSTFHVGFGNEATWGSSRRDGTITDQTGYSMLQQLPRANTMDINSTRFMQQQTSPNPSQSGSIDTSSLTSSTASGQTSQVASLTSMQRSVNDAEAMIIPAGIGGPASMNALAVANMVNINKAAYNAGSSPITPFTSINNVA